MDELVAWIREQLDEDERVAKGAYPGPWRVGYVDAGRAWQIISRDRGVARIPDSGFNEPNVQHIALHDPARVLREVEATRRLIRRYELACSASTSPVSFTRGQDDGYRQGCLDALRDRAEASYADRPGYRSEWAPSVSRVNPA